MTSAFRLGEHQYSLLDEAARVAKIAAARAPSLDKDAKFPSEDLDALARIGLLMAPFPVEYGGVGLGTTPAGRETLFNILRIIGSGSLPLGRLYEGHVNAVALVCRYGTAAQIGRLATEVSVGTLSAVWNSEPKDSSVRLLEQQGSCRLWGSKHFASGAGFIMRPLVTARTEAAELFMVMPRLDGKQRVDPCSWQAQGMRASGTATIDLSGSIVDECDVIGGSGDYLKEPFFSTGAWRCVAVQLGGIERVLDELRQDLRRNSRGADRHQLECLGQAGMAAETARLWVNRVSYMAENGEFDSDRATAYVGLARAMVERAGVEILELAEGSIGLSGFQRSHPLEIATRDLSIYLRQPGPDRILAEAGKFVLDSPDTVFDLWT
jgi:alkylation response protein AidB-like acyl-CoA dehydrogenase